MALSSEGVRQLQELLAPAPPDVLGGTWYGQRDWLGENVSQQRIIELYLLLWEELGTVNDAADESPEGKLADEIRGHSDIVWYAMSEESLEKLKGLIDERVKVQDPGLYEVRMRVRAERQSLASGGGTENSTR